MKYLNKHRSLGRIVFVDGRTQFLMFNQSIETEDEVKYTSKHITVSDTKPKLSVKRTKQKEDQVNLGE